MHKEPTLESFIDFSPENTFIDPFAGRRFEKKVLKPYAKQDAKDAKKEAKIEPKRNLSLSQRTLRMVGKVASVAAAILTPIAVPYATDVYQNYEYAVHAEVGLNDVAPPLDPKNSDTALFVVNGFNSTSSEPIIGTIGPAVQQAIDGRLVNFDTNNAQLGGDTYPGKNAQIGVANINELANQINDYNKKNGIENDVIVTYSMGCDTGTMTAEDLTRNPQLASHLKALVYISCPTSTDSLQDKTKSEVDFVNAVSPIPGAAYSSFVHYIGVGYVFVQDYEDGDLGKAARNARTLIPNVIKEVHRKDATGTWSLIDQTSLISQGDFDTRLHSIAVNTSNSLTPLVIDVRTAPTPSNPKHQDRVINDQKGAKEMRTDAQKAPLPYIPLSVAGAIHGEPEKTAKQFKQTFAAAKIAIQQALDLQEEIYNIKQIRDLSRQPILHIQKQ